jgi:beta-glucanase (GH16 family)
VSDGSLKLRADRDWNWSFGREWNSGNIRTWQEWSYGRVEVRAKVPWGRGFWPAIWLLPRTAPWPAGGELDIMEARGDLPWRISSAVHWGWDVANHQYVSQAYESGANFQDGYHTYAMEWDVGTVGFFVDGVEHMRCTSRRSASRARPRASCSTSPSAATTRATPTGPRPFPGSSISTTSASGSVPSTSTRRPCR